MSRKIYTDPNQVPPNAKVLGVRVRVPRVMFATDEGVLDEMTIHDTQLVYVEITNAEYQRLCGNQAAINAFGKSLGPEIAHALGGFVKAWHT